MDVPLPQEESLAAVLARASAIAVDFGITLGIPEAMEQQIVREVPEDGKKIDIQQLRVLADGTLEFNQKRVGVRHLGRRSGAGWTHRGAIPAGAGTGVAAVGNRTPR
jgi:hypothetical protein